MKRSVYLFTTLAIAACGGNTKPADPAEATTPPTTATAPDAAATTPDVAAAPDVPPPPPEGLVEQTPLDVAAAPADALKTASGLAYKVLKPGPGGDKPSKADTVKVFYVGWTTDGKKFDSRIPPKQPITFPLDGVIAGWTEGVQLMSKGDRFRFWIPKELAYNDRPGRPAGMLVFDVELVDIAKAPEVPADVAAPPADALKTASGLAYKVLTPSATPGEKPTVDATVTVHYTGWTTDGKQFDSSVARGQPATFPLKGVIPGWTEGLQLQDVGSKVRFWIPEALAYKDAKDGAPKGMLVFDVELLKATNPPQVPPDVAAAPADATKTASGLAYKVLTPGKGGPKPTADSSVTVHYSGWTTDGKMFDSSVTRGEPTSFPLKGVIAGWTEGLQVMEVGSKVRFWIPEELAYKGGEPKGVLVFDVELISFK